MLIDSCDSNWIPPNSTKNVQLFVIGLNLDVGFGQLKGVEGGNRDEMRTHKQVKPPFNSYVVF